MKITFASSLLLLAPVFASSQTLDTTAMVVMGEGLAAGMGNYGLSSTLQNKNFAALIAAKMETAIEQPLMQPPGIGDVVGYPGQEVQWQKYPQGSVRQFYLPTDKTKDPVKAPPLFVTNVSIPALTLNDAVTMKPLAPIVQKGNMKQTVFNMILGFPQLFLNNVPQLTQLQYAQSLMPTMVLVELGFYEALDAAVAGDPSRMPAAASFGSTYNTVLAALRSTQAQVIAMTIPNPIDTGYFNSAAAASAILPSNLNVDGYVTRKGLEGLAANRVFAPEGSFLSTATAATITANVNALNAQIVSAAKANGAVVYDLNAFLHKVKIAGATAGASTVTGDYLGGFYSLDGVYPGATGHALIANDILSFLNQTYGRKFELVNLAPIAASDPAVQVSKPKPNSAPSLSVRGRR